MLFVVNKARFQRMISIVRDDRQPKKQVPFLRIAAVSDSVTLSGMEVSASFPATVYDEGVLFIKTTYFRQLLNKTKIAEDFITFQVTFDGLRFADVQMPFNGTDLVLFLNPAEAPQSWPPEKQIPFDFDKIEEKQMCCEPMITAGSKSVPLGHSETGRLGITKAEFKWLITQIILKSRRSLSQRRLMGALLAQIGIRTQGKHREECVKDYSRCLNELKEAGVIKYISAKTAVHVMLSYKKPD